MKKQKLRVFPSGAVRTSAEGKADYVATISWTAMERYAQYLTSKMPMVGKGNFKMGIPIVEYEKAAMRHLQKHLANKEGANFEPNVDHISAAIFNLMGILHEEEMAKLKKSKKRK